MYKIILKYFAILQLHGYHQGKQFLICKFAERLRNIYPFNDKYFRRSEKNRDYFISKILIEKLFTTTNYSFVFLRFLGDLKRK